MASLRSLLGIQSEPSNEPQKVSGPDLRAERRAADVTVTALVGPLKLSRQSIHVLEKSAEVPSERVAQYRQALRDVIATSDVVS